jgi:ribonucleoside-triphosphate reductase
VCKNHGYIGGEEHVCSRCGEATEVYSRITGYYRPVKNWNEGKTQEFKERKIYNINTSEFGTRKEVSAEENRSPAMAADTKLFLFTTKICPNCKAAQRFLEESGADFEIVDAEENAELSKQYGVKQAPTLVAVNGGAAEKIVNASNIKKFAASIG